MRKRVLIVDDEHNIRRMMRLALEASGYEVAEASAGEQCLALFDDGSQWDAVVLDQRMPGLDGLETLRRIKQINNDARVVMATAYASIELAVDAMKLGATDFIRKPMTPETLRGALSAAISRKASSSSLNANAFAGRADPVEHDAIPTLTLNGFEITARQTQSKRTDQHHFGVTTPDGTKHLVIVEIASEAIDYVERLTHRRIPPENSFWGMQAERLLGNYLWNNGGIPANGRMTLKNISADKLLLAERWQL